MNVDDILNKVKLLEQENKELKERAVYNISRNKFILSSSIFSGN
jgi:hypothetical protein